MGQLSCLNEQDNIGVSSCKKIPNFLKGMITTPANFSLSFANAAISSNWQDALLAAKGSRIYLWPVAVMNENVNEAAVYEETPLSTQAVRDGRYRWRFSFQENLNLHKAMFSHQNFQGRVFLIDDKNQIIGTSRDGANFQGFTLDLLNPEKLLFNDGSVSSKTPVYVSLQDNLELDRAGCLIEASFINSLIRLTTVDLAIVGAPISTTIVVTVNSELDSKGVSGLLVADFVLLDGGGTPQTISGVVESTTIPGQYTLSGAGLVTGTLDLVAASALTVQGFESSGSVVVTIDD